MRRAIGSGECPPLEENFTELAQMIGGSIARFGADIADREQCELECLVLLWEVLKAGKSPVDPEERPYLFQALKNRVRKFALESEHRYRRVGSGKDRRLVPGPEWIAWTEFVEILNAEKRTHDPYPAVISRLAVRAFLTAVTARWGPASRQVGICRGLLAGKKVPQIERELGLGKNCGYDTIQRQLRPMLRRFLEGG